jgi:hypothetical protein
MLYNFRCCVHINDLYCKCTTMHMVPAFLEKSHSTKMCKMKIPFSFNLAFKMATIFSGLYFSTVHSGTVILFYLKVEKCHKSIKKYLNYIRYHVTLKMFFLQCFHFYVGCLSTKPLYHSLFSYLFIPPPGSSFCVSSVVPILLSWAFSF